MADTSRMLKTIFDRNLFDEKWYADAYPDVRALKMDPTRHFRLYGALMGRAPAVEFANDPYLLEVINLERPKKGLELRTAHELAQQGNHDLALSFAQTHVPDELSYTIDTLRANAALARNDEQGWLRHLNTYLGHFGASPVTLQDGALLLDRFASAELPAVTGGPLISVIMPAWNAEKTLRAAADSILAQSWRNLELLIMDDASEDGTWGVMQEIAARDSRVKIFRNKINVGPYVAKNIAVTMAQGEWITGHDADDWAHPQRLEHHMKEILTSPTPPRASVPYMLRFDPDGPLVRFSSINNHSLDGIARLCSIASTFNADFFREHLGSWDCIRFSADSELIERTKALIGDEFRKIETISMFCMDMEGSLTNNAVHGVDRVTGPSQIRVDYRNAFREWHKTLATTPSAARVDFPLRKETGRSFPAPESAKVPISDVRRNFAALTGNDEAFRDAVTAICCSKRPHFLEHIAAQLSQQRYENLHVIYVAHGPGHDLEKIRHAFSSLKSIEVLAFPDANATLGEALNLALDHCQTDLVAKIDDDDFYGPDYIHSSIAAFMHNGHEDVGIVGRGSAYCFVEDRDLLALRFPKGFANQPRPRVFGGTIFWSRTRLNNQKFQPLPRAVDTAFFGDAVAQGVKIYSCEPYDYVHVRYAQLRAHTWKVTSDEFLSKAKPVSKGLRLDIAYSTQGEPEIAQLPKHPSSEPIAEAAC